ncbi:MULTISPECIES: YihY family inner membrane protein [Thiomicrorhabdus]|uniref:YihY family inner membrane protein n=1 Tax=Thiomicrorhabdus heinhorstiae TaxID=2748010 RepID=A0ABS0BVK5_9GAMM|nr:MULTISPECIES: YihY family inner membrane protein [Thiomicrorhabdus]MBF6057847.1 YihY family inner membrane protein [Thiomicrorhabdus heinhorstiae]
MAIQSKQSLASLKVLPIVFSWRFWLKVFVRFRQRNGTDAVSILAYTTLIGLVPMLAVMLSLFSVSPFFSDFEDLVMDQVVHNLIPSSQPVIENYLLQFSQQAVHLKGPGLFVMFITTLMLLWKVDEKLNGLWVDPIRRKWWVSLLHYLGVSLLGPILLGLSLVVSTSVMAIPLLAETTPLIEKLMFGMSLLHFALGLLGFAALYKFVSIPYVPFRVALVAGLMATLQMELLKSGFALYVKWFPTYDLIYGAFAAVPLFLLWLYLIWFIVIWNGAVVATLVTYPSLTSSSTSGKDVSRPAQVKGDSGSA